MLSFHIHVSAFTLTQELELQRLESLLGRSIYFSGFKKELSYLQYNYKAQMKSKPYDLMVTEMTVRLNYVREYNGENQTKRSKPESSRPIQDKRDRNGATIVWHLDPSSKRQCTSFEFLLSTPDHFLQSGPSSSTDFPLSKRRR